MSVFETKKKSPSVVIAKDRLKLLLVSDRANCTPDVFEKIKSELFQTISKYLDIAPDKFEVQITRTDMHIKFTGEDL